ncbi:RNase H domain-containing protein [Trichonephila clavipes]|nr:RNase H domain-containing protein [Trichonephila clavipes]
MWLASLQPIEIYIISNLISFLYNQPLVIVKHPKYLGFILDPEILGNKHIDNIVFKARKRLNILRYISGRDWGADAATLRNTYISLIRLILEYGVPVYCSASVTNLQKLETVQLSTARIITGLKNTSPRHIVLFEADLQPLRLRRRACLTKYYNKLRSLDSRNRTSAYFKDWCNNQRLKRNSPLSQTSSPITMSCSSGRSCDRVFFHPELPIHVNKQADLPAYLKQLALERIRDIPIDDVQVFTDGSRDDYYLSGSGIYINLQDHILKIQRRNPDGYIVFRSALIAIDGALGSLASLPNEKAIWILSDSRSEIQHLNNWQTGHACSHPRVPRAHHAGLSRHSLASVGLPECVRCHGPGLALLSNGGVQQQQQKYLLIP